MQRCADPQEARNVGESKGEGRRTGQVGRDRKGGQAERHDYVAGQQHLPPPCAVHQ